MGLRRRLHLLALLLFVATLLYDLVVWGAVPALPDVGASIEQSARREAPLAATYIVLGGTIDAALPALQAFGVRRLEDAFGDGFERIRDDASVAMDLLFGPTWNASHRWVKAMYWAPPLLLLLTLLLWSRRPRAVHMIGRR